MYKFYIDGMEIHARETYQTIYKPNKQTFNLADGREANVPTPQLPKEFLLTAHIDFRESSDVFERLNLIIDRKEPVEFAISRETVDGEIINSEAYDVIVTSEIPFTEGASNGSFVVFNLTLIEYIPIKTKRIRQIAQTNKFTVQDKTTPPAEESVQEEVPPDSIEYYPSGEVPLSHALSFISDYAVGRDMEVRDGVARLKKEINSGSYKMSVTGAHNVTEPLYMCLFEQPAPNTISKNLLDINGRPKPTKLGGRY